MEDVIESQGSCLFARCLCRPKRFGCGIMIVVSPFNFLELKSSEKSDKESVEGVGVGAAV
jgi:hypothetical protein